MIAGEFRPEEVFAVWAEGEGGRLESVNLPTSRSEGTVYRVVIGTFGGSMTISIFSEDVNPISDLKVRTAAIIDQVLSTRRPLLLTRRGRGVAVLLDLEEYERLVDRGCFVEAVEEGLAAMEAGDLHPDAEAQEILGDFGC